MLRRCVACETVGADLKTKDLMVLLPFVKKRLDMSQIWVCIIVDGLFRMAEGHMCAEKPALALRA